MEHIFKQGTKDVTLLLLHGTGGNEHSLMELAEIIDADANVLSVRGNVLENGAPRFFKRLSEGVFDREDLDFRTKELFEFINESAVTYDFNRRKVIAIGYSNGANIAASLLFNYEQSLAKAILHHPMMPMRDVTLPNLRGVDVFIGAGINDPLCPAKEAEELESTLKHAGADVFVHWESAGHQLTHTEVEAARKYLSER